MENKKGAFANSGTTPTDETLINEAVPKHVHQHNTAPQHLRLLQYGLKIPNHQPSPHQHQSPPITPHLHQHQHRSQSPYQPPSSLLQSPHQHQANTLNVYQNQMLHHQQYSHQHQQKHPGKQTQLTHQNHFHYQPGNQQSLLLSHSVNQLNQQNAQIWVPHQPPGHYRSQQHKSEPQAHTFSDSSLSAKVKETEQRKKSSNTNNPQLRSPSAKRPLEAPVTIQGWLHKQGSDGLMLWKKRWFVLSEYCLFYYKGPEEEKLLGSILLPSYRVSACTLDDRVNRKFAFKCEHTNMRTYILAADSQELTMQWVRFLNMACLLQNTNEIETPANQSPSTSSQPLESSSVKHQQQVQIQNLRNTPIHTHSSSNTTDLSNPSQQELSQYSQPLYANAPPKPRRLTDGYSSPSSEVLDRYSGESKYVTLQYPQQYNVQPIYATRSMVKSPINVYGNPQAQVEYLQRPIQQQVYNKHLHMSEYGVLPLRDNHNVERRTPDTYGRSKLNPTKGTHPSDYEDVYADQSVYKRPLSPVAYTNNIRLNPIVSVPVARSYTPTIMRDPKDSLSYVPLKQLQKIPNTIPRPHSADFLEYEVKHQNSKVLNRQPRPKSSLDINRHVSGDNYFYTEERYAEKMRKSAQYLPKISKYPSSQQNEYATHQHKWQSTFNKCEIDNTFPLMRTNSRPTNFNDSNLQTFAQRDHQPVRSRSVLSDGSISKEIDMDLHPSPREHFDKDMISPVFHVRHEQIYGYNDNMRKSAREYDQFTRSASARLTQNNSQFEGRLVNREGERKREESMKRLLEWKQRMLQSPLNRKASQSISKGVSGKFGPYYRTSENGYPQVVPNLEIYSENRGCANTLQQYNSYSSDDEASGSISITTRDTFPRSMSAKKVWNSNSRPLQSKSTTNLTKNYENDYPIARRSQQGCFSSQSFNQHDLGSDTSHSSNSRRSNLPKMDSSKRLENLQKLEQIKQHLLELEKQYEKGKPLVNLVDNMVKLGSLYRFPKDHNNHPHVKDRLEFNQQIQERRLLAEERRDWNRLSPNQSELQAKVQQLYQLDRLIQEESETLQGLQQDKEDIERALGGLRHRLIKGFKDPAEVEQARKQQIVLENELSRVHSMLAQNSRKLEETVAGNARLEQELLVLKQKLQISRQQRSSPQISNAGDSLPCVIGTSAMLESDLHRVQQKVGDLQRQRQELSMQVRQLTDRSNNLQQLKPSSAVPVQIIQGNKKKMNLLWRETDLDTMNSVDHGDSCDSSIILSSAITSTPTNIRQPCDTDFCYDFKSNNSASVDVQNQNAVPQEKQEIKTVRIVKRESERRQRDREKTVTGKWDTVVEEEDSSQNSSILFRPTPVQSSTNIEIMSANNSESDKSSSGILSRQGSLSHPSLPQVYSDIRNVVNVSVEGSLDKSPELSPIFKSEAAKQIIIEMSAHDMPKQSNRRMVPKEKRRHYTAPHNNLIMKSLNQLPTDDKDFDKLDINVRRARDDLDMERALRQRIDAPDVVRSTLSSKELKYNESTIDNILGTPNKIFIPERYVPEQLPQLSVEEQQHRLRKVESIKKMLSDTTIISGSSVNLASDEQNSVNASSSSITSKATSKMIEEKKQREHLLQLNQILAKQVMEMSKIVAGSNNPGE